MKQFAMVLVLLGALLVVACQGTPLPENTGAGEARPDVMDAEITHCGVIAFMDGVPEDWPNYIELIGNPDDLSAYPEIEYMAAFGDPNGVRLFDCFTSEWSDDAEREALPEHVGKNLCAYAILADGRRVALALDADAILAPPMSPSVELDRDADGQRLVHLTICHTWLLNFPHPLNEKLAGAFNRSATTWRLRKGWAPVLSEELSRVRSQAAE